MLFAQVLTQHDKLYLPKRLFFTVNGIEPLTSLLAGHPMPVFISFNYLYTRAFISTVQAEIMDTGTLL